MKKVNLAMFIQKEDCFLSISNTTKIFLLFKWLLYKTCLISIFLFSLMSPSQGLADNAISVKHYNITACENPKFIWFRVAKNGTRSILYSLSQYFDFSVSGHRVPFSREDSKDYFKFSFVRNPWDRVVSCYFNKVVSEVHAPFQECFGKDFDYFVDYIKRKNVNIADIHIRKQCKLFPVHDVNFIGRVEDFDEDVSYIFHILGVDNVDIPRHNSSSHSHYSSYYTERTKNIIAEKYSEDISLFGYSFETM